MKLTDAQRFDLFKTTLAAVVQRQAWPRRAPDRQDGSPGKEVTPQFGCAVHAFAITRAAVHVLESEDEPRGDGTTPHAGFASTAPLSSGSAADTPF